MSDSIARSCLLAVAGAAMSAALALSAAPPAMAQDSGVPMKYPGDGLPILDCDPAPPVPADSCILRVPPSLKRGKIEKEELGEASGAFNFIDDTGRLPGGLEMSRSIVLIDLSPGVNGARKPTWPRERAMIARLIRALPADQEVALYGFNEGLDRLVGFTTDHGALARQVEALELRGANTRIATNVRDAIRLLGKEDKVVFRHLIVISDGREEGERDPAEVTSTAIAEGVTVSGLAMLWGPVGAPANGAGMDYLQLLSEGTRGETRAIQLRAQGNGEPELSAFIEGVRGAMDGSGLIVPDGAPVAAEISVVLNRPVPGQAGRYSEERAQARFVPAAERHGPPPPPPEEPGWLDRDWLGLRILWWLMGAGALALAGGLLAAMLLARRGSQEESEVDDLDWNEGSGATEMPVAPPAPAAGPALAYLLRDDNGTRVPIRVPRVTIGRASNCDVEIADASISRLHAELEQQRDGSFLLSDAGSLNGTLLNDHRIKAPQSVKPGDIITVGKIRLRFSQA